MNFEEFVDWIHKEPEKLTGAAKRKKKMRPADHLHNRLIDKRERAIPNNFQTFGLHELWEDLLSNILISVPFFF